MAQYATKHLRRRARLNHPTLQEEPRWTEHVQEYDADDLGLLHQKPPRGKPRLMVQVAACPVLHRLRSIRPTLLRGQSGRGMCCVGDPASPACLPTRLIHDP